LHLSEEFSETAFGIFEAIARWRSPLEEPRENARFQRDPVA
jgi:hypothetical protein